MRKSTVFFGLVIFGLTLQLNCACDKQSKPPATAPQTQTTSSSGPTSATASFLGHPWPTVAQNNQRTSCSPLPGPDIPELKWSVQLTGDNGKYGYGLNRSPLVAQGNITYVQVAKTILNSVSADGQLLWAKNTEHNFKQPLVAFNGNLLGAGETVYSVEKNTGKISKYFDRGFNIPMLLDFDYEFDIPIQVSENILVVETQVNVTSKLDQLDSFKAFAIALNQEGKQLWKTELSSWSIYQMAAGANGQVFIPTSGKLVSLSNQGDQQWTFDCPNGGSSGHVLTGPGDCIVYYGKFRPICNVLDKDGNLLWAKDYSPLKVSQVSFDHQGQLLIGLMESRKQNSPSAIDRFLVKLDQQGNEIWRIPHIMTGAFFPTIDANDNIYFCNEEGVYSLSNDGSKRWKLNIPDCTGQVVIGEDNRLFVLGKGGMLHCIGEAD